MPALNPRFHLRPGIRNAILLAAVLVFAAGFGFPLIPLPVSVSSIRLHPEKVAAFTQTESIVALLAEREITIQSPEAVWSGMSSEIRLSLSGNPAAVPSTSIPPGDGNAVIAARLEMDGVEAFQGERRQPLLPGQEIEFHWQMRAVRPEPVQGKLWLHLEWVPSNGSEIETILLLARPVELQAKDFLGIPSNLVRGVSAAGVGVVLFILFRRLIRRKQR